MKSKKLYTFQVVGFKKTQRFIISGTTDAININLREYILYLVCFDSIENIKITTVDELFEGVSDYYIEKIGVRIL